MSNNDPLEPRALGPAVRSLRLAFLPLVLALAAAGCSSGAPSSEDDGSGAVSSADALTSEEAELGAAWDGREEDDLSADEEAALSWDQDPSGDLGPSSQDVSPQGVHPLAGCTRTTGFNKGKAMSICTTTLNGKAVEQATAASFIKMRDAAARAGVSIVVVSGFRTMQKQRDLYAAYRAGRGNLAAPPGYSNHQSGHALDLNTKGKGVNAWLVRNAATFGFRRTVPSENWHYEKW